MLNAGTLSSYGKGLEKLLSHPGIQHLAGSTQAGNQAQPQLFKADVRLLLDGDEVLQEKSSAPPRCLSKWLIKPNSARRCTACTVN